MGTPAFAEVGPCPISADFATEPETFETMQQMGQYEVTSTTKRAFVDGAIVQIECTGIAPDQFFPGVDDATILANYAQFWSIQPTGPAFMDSEPIDHYVIEGVKEIQGIEVTYTYRLFRFDDSFAMVATGVPGGQPPPDAQRFLASIRLDATAPAPYTGGLRALDVSGLQSVDDRKSRSAQSDGMGRDFAALERARGDDENDAFKDESFGSLAARRGRQFSAGAVDVIASQPEAFAISQAEQEGNINAQAPERIQRANKSVANLTKILEDGVNPVTGTPFTMAERQTENELADGRRNHIAACLPAVRADNEARQLSLSEVEITYFCSCTGQRYFAEFTRPELRTLAMGDDASLEQRRLGIQTECFEEAIR